MPLVRAWMQSSAEAPRWSDAELTTLSPPAPVTGPVTGGRERHGWGVVNTQDELAGFLVATALHTPPAAAECELEFLCIAPSLRSSGAGRALLRHLHDWAQRLPAKEIWLEVRASNAAARRLYATSGFVEAGVRPGYYQHPREDAVLMRLAVSHPGSVATV